MAAAHGDAAFDVRVDVGGSDAAAEVPLLAGSAEIAVDSNQSFRGNPQTQRSQDRRHLQVNKIVLE